MTRQLTAVALAALVLAPAAAFAQANPFTDAVKAQLAQIKAPIIRTAEKVGEDLYAFKPTPGGSQPRPVDRAHRRRQLRHLRRRPAA